MSDYRQTNDLDLESLRARLVTAARSAVTPAQLASTTSALHDLITGGASVVTEEHEIRVPAFERSRNFYSIDRDGHTVQVGTASRREYDADRKVAYAQMQASDGNHYVVGQVSQLWDVVDHAAVMRPLIDSGFKNVQLLNHRSGGVSVLALLSNPDVTLKDSIAWDRDLFTRRDRQAPGGQHWAGADRGDLGNLEFAAKVTSSIAYGTSIKIEYGFFRKLCDNGLVAEILGLGGHTFTHRGFNRGEGGLDAPREITGRIERLVNDFDQAGGAVANLPQLASQIDTRALDWPIEILKRVAEDGSTEALSGLPDFAQAPFERLLTRMPVWSPGPLVTILEAARQEERIGTFDLVNALTNVATPEMQPSRVRGMLHGEPSFIIYDRLNPLAQALKDVVDIGAFRSDISWSAN